jgi:rubrerythrin
MKTIDRKKHLEIGVKAFLRSLKTFEKELKRQEKRHKRRFKEASKHIEQGCRVTNGVI